MLRARTYYYIAALAVCSLTGCIGQEEVPCDSRVQLMLSVASQQGQTDSRLADNVTLVDGTSVRLVNQFRIIPYSVQRKITATDVPYLDPFSEVSNVASKDRQYHYYGRPEDDLTGAASFLCYGRPNAIGTTAKENGSITTNLYEAIAATGDIYFAPTPIYDHDNEAHASATRIADYLTGIATAGGWNTTTDTNWKLLFDIFTNNGELMAGSTANVTELVKELQNSVANRMDAAGDETLQAAILAAIGNDIEGSVGSGFPGSIGLPDGAAVLQWNGARFEPQTLTTTMAQTVSQNRYAYPAEMYFYANSQVDTSDSEVPSTEYVDKTWYQVLALYTNKEAVIQQHTRGAAVIDQLRYGVGSLKITVAAETATLKDADEKEIVVGTDNFPLTGLLVSGQYRQGFDFTPKDNINEYVCYDSQFSNVYLQQTDTPTAFSTLAFQTKDNDNVWIALEFENRSEEIFRGVNGLVYPGTKFYLVGELKLDTTTATQDYERRVFTQAYLTQATLKVTSLANAYNVIPDLLSGRMEVGVQLVEQWIEPTTTPVILK